MRCVALSLSALIYQAQGQEQFLVIFFFVGSFENAGFVFTKTCFFFAKAQFETLFWGKSHLDAPAGFLDILFVCKKKRNRNENKKRTKKNSERSDDQRIRSRKMFGELELSPP